MILGANSTTFVAAQMIHTCWNQILVKFHPLNKGTTQSLESKINTNTFGYKEYALSFAIN